MRQSGECVFGKPGGMEPCWMNLTMRELGRIGSEIRLDKTWAVRNEVLAVQTLKPPNIPVDALTPHQFEVYATYDRRACDEYEGLRRHDPQVRCLHRGKN